MLGACGYWAWRYLVPPLFVGHHGGTNSCLRLLPCCCIFLPNLPLSPSHADDVPAKVHMLWSTIAHGSRWVLNMHTHVHKWVWSTSAQGCRWFLSMCAHVNKWVLSLSTHDVAWEISRTFCRLRNWLVDLVRRLPDKCFWLSCWQCGKNSRFC